MKEITDKLAHELLHELKKAEYWCDERASEAKKDYGAASKVHTDLATASQIIFGARVHLSHHMQDMIEHPDYKPEESK